MWKEDSTLPVSSTLAPQHGPRTSWGTVTARALTALQPCTPVQENLLPFLETGSKQHKAYLQMEKLRNPEAKPSVQGHMASEWQSWIEPRAVYSQSQNSNSTQQAGCRVVKSMGLGPGQPGSTSRLCHWGP